MKKGSRYYALMCIRALAGILFVLQILGLIPALTWLKDINAVTPDLIVKALIKVAVMVISYCVYRWAGAALNKGGESSQANASDVPSANAKAGGRENKRTLAVIILVVAVGFLYLAWPATHKSIWFSSQESQSEVPGLVISPSPTTKEIPSSKKERVEIEPRITVEEIRNQVNLELGLNQVDLEDPIIRENRDAVVSIRAKRYGLDSSSE